LDPAHYILVAVDHLRLARTRIVHLLVHHVDVPH
jgi:hypothetical protein